MADHWPRPMVAHGGSNFLVLLTTRAAAFNTPCTLSVVVFGAAARTELQ